MTTTTYVALLRAVNVGGTGKLSMSKLVELCEAAGFSDVQTYIASGNVIFRSKASEAKVRLALEKQLHASAGKPIGVLVRTAREMADVVARNPFGERPGSQVMALFTDEQLPADALDGASGVKNEQIQTGARELFVYYPDGMGKTRLRLPVAQSGTARNMNTVSKLAELAAAMV